MSSVVPWYRAFFDQTYSNIRNTRHVFLALELLAKLEPPSGSLRAAIRQLSPDSPLLPLIVSFTRSRISMMDYLRTLLRSVHVARISRYFEPMIGGRGGTQQATSALLATDEQRHVLMVDAASSNYPDAKTTRALHMTLDDFRFIRSIVKESRDRREFLMASLAQQTSRIAEMRARLDQLRHIVDLEHETAQLLTRIDTLQMQQANQTLSMAANLQIQDTETSLQRDYDKYLETHQIRMRAKNERRAELDRAIDQLRHVSVETQSFHSDTWRAIRHLQNLVVRNLPDNVSKIHKLCAENEEKYETAKRDWPRALTVEIERQIRNDKILSQHQRAEQLNELEDYVRAVQQQQPMANDSATCIGVVICTAADSFPRPVNCADVTNVHVAYCQERAKIGESLKRSRYTSLTEADPSRGVGGYAFISKEDHARILETERLIGYLYSHGTSILTTAMLRAYNIGRPFDRDTMIHYVNVNLDSVNTYIFRDLRTMDARFGLVPPELGRFLVSLFAVRYNDEYRDEETIVAYMDDHSRVHKSRERLYVKEEEKAKKKKDRPDEK